MRLDAFLAKAAQMSRADAKQALRRGRVTVDGRAARDGALHVDENAAVALDGAPLTAKRFVYIMLDKPEGVVSASRDARDTTAADLVRDAYPPRELSSAGRPDKTSTGFVLLTDDGAFAHDILAPRRHVAKTYEVTVDAPVTRAMIDGFAAGVTLADGTRLAPAALRAEEGAFSCEVVLTQGVYHQIKRMFGVFGAGVCALRRTAIGGVRLDASLGPGGFRELTEDEMASLRNAPVQLFQKINTIVP